MTYAEKYLELAKLLDCPATAVRAQIVALLEEVKLLRENERKGEAKDNGMMGLGILR